MKPEKPPIPPVTRPSRSLSNDFSFDPLPVPDAVESNSDTVWGLWESSLQEDAGTEDMLTQPGDFDQMTEPQDFDDVPTQQGTLTASVEVEEPDHGFQATVPASLEDLDKLFKR